MKDKNVYRTCLLTSTTWLSSRAAQSELAALHDQLMARRAPKAALEDPTQRSWRAPAVPSRPWTSSQRRSKSQDRGQSPPWAPSLLSTRNRMCQRNEHGLFYTVAAVVAKPGSPGALNLDSMLSLRMCETSICQKYLRVTRSHSVFEFPTNCWTQKESNLLDRMRLRTKRWCKGSPHVVSTWGSVEGNRSYLSLEIEAWNWAFCRSALQKTTSIWSGTQVLR